jgi:hypothetical protein
MDTDGFGIKGVKSDEPSMHYEGYYLLRPNTVFIINPNIQYFTAYNGPVVGSRGQRQAKPRQILTDVLLVEVQPIG